MPTGDTADRRRVLIARHRQVFAARWQTAIVVAMFRRALAYELAAVRGRRDVKR
jgi:hypothetical protein